MPGFNQSSLLFTLQSLKDLEHQRATGHGRPRTLLAEVDRAPVDRERRQREAERQRKERARVEAMKQAAVAQALAEAEARARVELLARQQQHRERLAAIDAEATARRQKMLARFASAVALVVMAGTLGVYFFKVRPETQRIQSAYDRLVAADGKRTDDIEQLLTQERKRRERLARQLEQAETQVAALEKKTGARGGH